MTQQLNVIDIDPALYGLVARQIVQQVVVLADSDSAALAIARKMARPGLEADEVYNGRYLSDPGHLDAIKSDLAAGAIVVDKTDVPLTLAAF